VLLAAAYSKAHDIANVAAINFIFFMILNFGFTLTIIQQLFLNFLINLKL